MTLRALGLVACDRPALLERALGSYLENLARHSAEARVFVVDDSSRAETREAQRALVGNAPAPPGVALAYAGREEKERFARQLAARGLPEEPVRFALFGWEDHGPTTGANRNALLLESAGERVLSADDDTVCALVDGRRGDQQAVLARGMDPAEHWFFPSEEAALGAAPVVDASLLALHDELLGVPVRERVPDAPGGTVLVTFTGLLGDCGWGSPQGYLFMTGDSHRRLVASEPGYAACTQSRQLLRVVSRPAISDASFCMTYCAGLDHRALLPPFVPIKRGQDVAFGAALSACSPEAAFAHLPWAIRHQPRPARRFWPGEIARSASGFDTCTLITGCIRRWPGTAAADPAERMRSLGAHLMALGRLPAERFQAEVRSQAIESRSARLALLEERLQAWTDAPAGWAADARRYVQIARETLQHPDAFAPLDLVLDGLGFEQARALGQRLVGRYGALLERWPDIVEAALRLREEGQRLACAPG